MIELILLTMALAIAALVVLTVIITPWVLCSKLNRINRNLEAIRFMTAANELNTRPKNSPPLTC
jgi:hypothetical protein